MIKKIILIFLVSSVLIGCNSQIAKLPPYTIDNTLVNPTLLVVKINDFDYLDIKRIEDSAKGESVSNKLELANVKLNESDRALHLPKQEYRILKSNYMFKPFSYANAMYLIEPGKYYISFIAIDIGKGPYYSEAPGINKQHVVQYGAFEIKPGEVLYLGDLECQWMCSNKVKKLYAKNNINLVQEDLHSAGMPEFANRIRQIDLLPKGTVLN